MWVGRNVMGNLSALAVQRAAKVGRVPDGKGLYLQVTATGTKSWIFRFTLNGRTREMGLGPLELLPLAEARKRATECRQVLLEGKDPIIERESVRRRRSLEEAQTRTFASVIEEYIELQAPKWRDPKNAPQWRNSLARHASPTLGQVVIAEVTKDLVMQVLKKIWYEKPETANRVRSRIEQILDYATVMGYRAGDNPARWGGNLEHMLQARRKVKPVEHFPSVHRDDLGAFLAKLEGVRGRIGQLALEFLILTTTRTSETLGAEWAEFNLESREWLIPAARMKAGRDHRVPLSSRAIEILREMEKYRESQYVFPGRRVGRPLSQMALLQIMRKLDRKEVPHGFRSTFRDWAEECTDYHPNVAEMALAHTVKGKTEASYRRGDLFEKRRLLMDEWAEFCSLARIRAREKLV
jgi:integrase